MADNIDVKDAAAATVTVGAKDLSSVFYPRHIITNDAADVLTGDLMLDIASGAVTGKAPVNKFGANDAIADGVAEDVWDGGGTYSYPATATITHIRTENDTPAMDGLVVEVQGLEISAGDWILKVQNVTIDAATSTDTEVALGTALVRVFRMRVLGNIVTTDDIWLGATGVAAGTAKAIIQTGNNQTLMALYTVPSGKTAYMTKSYANMVKSTAKAPDSVTFELWMADRDNSYEFQLKGKQAVELGGGGLTNEPRPYAKITQKTDIKISATPSGDAASVYAGFDLILVDN